MFKGEVTKVNYILPQNMTILIDSSGKTTELHGFPGIPCAEIEIYHHGGHEYQIFQSKEPLTAQ